MKSIIKVLNLKKSYGKREVLKGISFEVQKGEIFALLGTNGAGKTTTLECMEKLRQYEAGEIQVNGSLGVQLQSSSLPNNIRILEAIELFSKWKKTQVDSALMKRLGLDDMKHKKYRELSTGQKRRLHLCMALIGNPEIIFLDEPTAGLDVEGRIALHDEIRNLKKQGKTMIMASHDMAEVEELCDHIAILKDGKIAFLGTIIELKEQVQSSYRLHIKTSEKLDLEKPLHVKPIAQVQGYQVYETEVIETTLGDVLKDIQQQQLHLVDIKVEQASLEERFMDIAREE